MDEYMNTLWLKFGDTYEKLVEKVKNNEWKELIIGNKEAFGFIALSLVCGTMLAGRRRALTNKSDDCSL